MANRKQEIKEYDLMLQKHIDKKDFIKISRTFKDREENIAGFLLAISKDFLLLQIDNEFLLDGYAIIPKTKFDSIRCNRYEKTLKKIHKKEGHLDSQYGIYQNISIKTWQDLFTDLKKADYHVIVECEDNDEPDFTIGPIKKIYKNKVGIQYYDPTGKLDVELTSVPYNEITIIKFGDRYSTTFRKYLRESTRKKS
ncbi:hypothetical protein [Pseudobacter ginsenosidimutans]|uniref:Uncharacterized protein n=1 Tax=Pseudobacter ginsenosidimutans TaxID=661488 RepID=A0A4Q7N3H3_9BACT|nr:hypothetical protein [Pseudobacter ginsenosidimutans]QEC44017.1 hypothetical protein FSB84_20905 [Pseudobacter ginsenosidimutans]RZS75455.1 hypothetical protein EV199_1321 [Pseudobacter ginsenosidimutans]